MKNIIELAFNMTEAVSRLKDRVRQFYYAVMLSGCECPGCAGHLRMMQEGLAECMTCGYQLDPTIVFQRCSCGGQPKLLIRSYSCRQCGAGIRSRFLFDGLVFDTEYFREKMAESRKRKRERRERVRKMLIECRSGAIQPSPADLGSVPGLIDALNSLTTGIEPFPAHRPSDGFCLKRYQRHIQAHLRAFPVTLDEIPPLSENVRKDKIWRFIAIIFLAHAGLIEIRQQGQNIMVIQRETDTERQRVPGDLTDTDEPEGAVGRTEA